jgi:aryl-phospho-beta-D-glucosidase BglC (GH1 family)
MAQFHRLNMNLIRLSVPWEAVQPNDADSFDEDYLAQILSLVRRCRTAGIYVIIEAHQDLYCTSKL